MSLSIHYSGRIKETALISQPDEKVLYVCNALEWPAHIIDNDDFKRICFVQKNANPFSLHSIVPVKYHRQLYYLIIKQSAQAATFRHYLQSRAGVRIYQQAFV